MGTKKPASPTAVVAAGRQCLRPPLPQRQGLIQRYPRMSRESIIAAAAPTVTRRPDASWLPSHAHNAASARKLARKNLSSSGRTATTISRDRNVQPIVGRLRHRPYADRHCCGCLMSAPLGPRVAARKKERIRPNRVCRIVASSRTGRFGLLGPFQAGMMPN